MSRRKDIYLVLDTETLSDNPKIIYDFGYKIIDKQGINYIERNFYIKEVYENKLAMQTAKFRKRDEKVFQPSVEAIAWEELKKQINKDIKDYKVNKIGAYNISFDLEAIRDTNNFFSINLKPFFPLNIKYIDIWGLACQTILDTKRYRNFCIENNLLSEKGNFPTNAECCFKFLINNAGFVESHTALADILIECEILQAIFKSHKKKDLKINKQCWKLVQKK